MATKHDKSDVVKYVVSIAIGLIPGCFFAWFVARLLDLRVWVAWLGVQGIILLNAGIVQIIEGVGYRLIWRNTIVDKISESLSKLEYPNLKKYLFISSAEDYFGSVMQDEDIDIGVRLDAAHTQGELAAVSQFGFFRSMRIRSAMMDAVFKYHKIKFGGRDYSADQDTED